MNNPSPSYENSEKNSKNIRRLRFVKKRTKGEERKRHHSPRLDVPIAIRGRVSYGAVVNTGGFDSWTFDRGYVRTDPSRTSTG
jgi:hypothetical protein